MAVIPELEFKSMLDRLDFRQPRRFLIENPEDYKGEFPAVIKVSSDKITHKTEIGAVVQDIRTMDNFKEVFKSMRSKFPGETLYAEEMARKGVEIIIGLINDKNFGKLLLFGIGGFYSELFRDVTFKKVPIDGYDAEDILSELKFGRIFDGYRGLKVNKEVIVELLLKVSKFANSTDYSQVDFNPVFLYEDGYLIIDAKMIV